MKKIDLKDTMNTVTEVTTSKAFDSLAIGAIGAGVGIAIAPTLPVIAGFALGSMMVHRVTTNAITMAINAGKGR